MAKSTIAEILSEKNFFFGLKPEYINFLAGCASKRQIRKDEVLFPHGQTADRFFMVLSGRITLEVAAIEGPPLELQSVGADEMLGWSWLIPPYKWTFQARTVEPTEVLEFDGKAVFERCEKEPELGYELLKRFSALMSERLAFARRKMMEEWSPPGFA